MKSRKPRQRRRFRESGRRGRRPRPDRKDVPRQLVAPSLDRGLVESIRVLIDECWFIASRLCCARAGRFFAHAAFDSDGFRRSVTSVRLPRRFTACVSLGSEFVKTRLKDGSAVTSSQIAARVSKYPQPFGRTNDGAWSCARVRLTHAELHRNLSFASARWLPQADHPSPGRQTPAVTAPSRTASNSATAVR